MGLRKLTSGEMMHTTSTWVEPTHRHHQLLATSPEVAALLPHLTRAHKGILSCQPSAAPSAGILARQVEELDAQHDDLVRGIHALFTALTFLAASPSERELWGTLRDKLFPDGLALVMRSFADEAGQAALAVARLTADDRKRMKAAAFGATNLLGLFEQYGQVARKLGDAATAKATPPQAVVSRAESASARNQWIRVVSAILAAIEMTDKNEELIREVVAPLRDIERKADRRRAGAVGTLPLPSPSPALTGSAVAAARSPGETPAGIGPATPPPAQ